MRAQGRSRPVLANRLGITEIALRRQLELRHHLDIRAIDRALAAMNAELAIELPDYGPEGGLRRRVLIVPRARAEDTRESP